MHRWFPWIVAAFVICLTGCGNGNSAPRKLRSSSQPVSIGIRVGQQAPEIQGEDLDGQWMKLSDSRGKVVVLYFWGQWCGVCRSNYSFDRALIQHFEHRPFVFLGVNSDGSRDYAREAMKRENLPWRAWWDGRSGPLASAWNIDYYPSTYVLDDRGVIIQRDPDPRELVKVVEVLLKEMQETD